MKDIEQALLKAIEHLDVERVRFALKRGGDAHAYHQGRSLIGCCLDATYPWPNLFDPRVAWIIRWLVEAGAEPDVWVDEDVEGTALHEAAMHGPYRVVETLLDAGANPNLLCEDETALDTAEFDYWYHSTGGVGGDDSTILAWADLPALPAPDEDANGEEAFNQWIRWSQQQFIPLLRRRGARRCFELERRDIKDGLWVDADMYGGLATRWGAVQSDVWESLDAATRDAMDAWCANYVNPWIEGFDAARVAAFDYDGHARTGLELAQRLAAKLKPGVPMYFVALSRAALQRRSHETTVWQWTSGQPVFVQVKPDCHA